MPISTLKIKFTDDQESAINGIISFLNAPFNPANFTVGLTGAGGTGKTFITKYILNNCNYSDSVIKCTSPTHKACRVFSASLGGKDVDTIQSTFGMRIDVNLDDFNPDNPKFAMKGKIKLDNIRLLVIDESSMLNAALVTTIYNMCKQRECKLWFIGDENQLAPVNERTSIAFKRCTNLYRLNQIVRQEEDNPIKELLNIIREDINNKTCNFIKYINNYKNFPLVNQEGKGISIVGQSEFINIISIMFKDEAYTKNINLYRIIAYTNDKVNSWNHFVRNEIIKDSEQGIITRNDLLMAYETIVDEYLSPIIYNSEEYIIRDINDINDTKYDFKGYLVTLQMVNGGRITKPLFILDHRDKATMALYYKISNDLKNDALRAVHNKVSKWKNYYDFKRKYLIATNIKLNNSIVYSRDIDYGFAITSHKSQGSTYKNVFVDLNDLIFDKNGRIYNNLDDMLRRVYVACSRASDKLIICYG